VDNPQRILFITPIQHLRNFYGYVLQNHTIIEMVNPTYDDVKIQLPNWDILFCAPNHQTFVIDEELVKDTDIKCILTPSTGVNHIDVESIPIISLKGDKILDDVWSTAEHTLYLILSIVRGKHELHDKTLGIIGYGRLGKMVEKLCKPLFKKIITIDKKSKISELSEFYKDSDVVSIHMDLNPTTENLIGNDFLSFFSKSIYLINTARGEIVNEHDIKHLLSVGRIKGYATDVLQSEYNGKQSTFEEVENVIVTPHIAGTSPEAQEKTYKRVLEKYENNS
jgi:lactate dehydrogenase-like 2-hydroxyacid dehydrogenase